MNILTTHNSSISYGYFGPVTATLDWCEANYQFSHYIAEMANTLSNLFTIWLAYYGSRNAEYEKLPLRYTIGNAGIALVGVGSFAFHATLLYHAQLADELPMIYVAAVALFLVFDTQPGFGTKSTRTQVMLFAMASFNILFTWSYYLYRNPVYHQVIFAVLVFVVAARITYLLRWSPMANILPQKQKSEIAHVFGMGTALFVFGFFIWNLDNIFCDWLTSSKVYVGWPTAFFLEGHSWWHIFTGVGTYLKFVGIQYITLCLKDSPNNYVLGYVHGVPHVQRVGKRID